jgi:hypothetical protein
MLTQFWLQSLKERDRSENLHVDEEKILKLILRERCEGQRRQFLSFIIIFSCVQSLDYKNKKIVNSIMILKWHHILCRCTTPHDPFKCIFAKLRHRVLQGNLFDQDCGTDNDTTAGENVVGLPTPHVSNRAASPHWKSRITQSNRQLTNASPAHSSRYCNVTAHVGL